MYCSLRTATGGCLSLGKSEGMTLEWTKEDWLLPFGMMSTMKLVLTLLFSGIITSCRSNSTYNLVPRLLLVSFDGFRADYLKKYELPHLHKFIEEGVLVEHVKNVFITKTFPNHYSIVTGLYEENHGIVANSMYDAETQKRFSESKDKDPFWWNEATPIWVTNELEENRTSAAAMWPGTDVAIHNTTPFYFMNYNPSVTFGERLDNITKWLNNSDPLVTFATLYWEEPDASGHKYGPEDKEQMSTVLKEVDNHIGHLVHKLKMLGLWESLNVIITSDHGMTQCSKDKMIKLDACIDRSSYTIVDTTPVAAILPKEIGDHGYDNALPSMHPFLAAHGPAFHKGYKHSTINIVDIYPMMCHILGLKPHPNNGTFSNTKCLLADQWCINLPEAIGIVIGAFLVLTTLTCLIIITKNKLSVPRPFSRLQLQEEDDDDPLIG
ncbi:bis(5'-adenosyl)-triphosphatase ENPP4 isoform X2 [Vombatus ursinus]|uniref:bis(5'-adenosyl)-triphosphatase ENPP4 isoform X2 n=1 Tax=Vombatus ursinus TaxID=29139 RepID=UPI000FFCF755|nr:bis(5'-adenosyl)-triphosphatase ENPP4 isoform X2 [Vombatus ursinus]